MGRVHGELNHHKVAMMTMIIAWMEKRVSLCAIIESCDDLMTQLHPIRFSPLKYKNLFPFKQPDICLSTLSPSSTCCSLSPSSSGSERISPLQTIVADLHTKLLHCHPHTFPGLFSLCLINFIHVYCLFHNFFYCVVEFLSLLLEFLACFVVIYG